MILAFRWATLGTPAPHGLFVASVVITLVILVAGLAHFSRASRTIADDI
jgi:ABC-type polysaccharide/polyol phosphate export permease